MTLTSRPNAPLASAAPPVEAALSPRALAAALNGVSTATVIAIQEAAPPPPHRPTPLAVGVVAPAAPIRALRDRVRAREGRADLLLFRVGSERFAVALDVVDEAVEISTVGAMPDMPPGMLGMTVVRDRHLPVFSPAAVLGVAPESRSVALLAHVGDRRIAVAVDDVEDVIAIDLAELREPPGGTDGVVLAVARRGEDLATVIDWTALVELTLGARLAEST